MRSRLRQYPKGLVLALQLGLSLTAWAQVRAIDTERSTVTVHVFKAGLFSALGHEHEVRAPIASGTVEVSQADPKVELAFHARQLQALDPDLKPSDRAEVQATMLGPKVLDAERFPEIRFRSTRVTRDGAGWRVDGELTLRGQTRRLTLGVTEAGGRYLGSVKLKQRDFGITPVTVAGGTVKVKDELQLEFAIVPK